MKFSLMKKLLDFWHSQQKNKVHYIWDFSYFSGLFYIYYTNYKKTGSQGYSV